MSKVSVIIPVYNVEAYLRQCLDSVVNQTLKEIEIICIDDGSTDGSAAILQEYAAKDERIKILTQVNSGAGAARNAGLAAAKGEWLSFLDADDEFAPEMFSEMVGAGEQSSADVVACTMTTNGNIFQRWRGWAWDKMFRREFILSQNLKFQNLPVSNDLFFTYSALALSSRTIAIAKDYVFHRKRPGSVETTRDRAPLAPLDAVKALYERIGMVDGFARWFPEFVFWHINRLKKVESSNLLYRHAKEFAKSLGIVSTRKWCIEEVKRLIKKFLRKVVLR
jgi:glycosyltransferase involved in cell wall biosynthesis